MAVSVARFKEEYPEFTKTSDKLCSRKLAAATKRVASSVWGNRTDDGIMLLTAHLISMSPQGEQARLKLENRGTMYKVDFKDMKKEVTAGYKRVI